MNDKTFNLKRKQQMNDFDFETNPNMEIGKKMRVDVPKLILMPVHIVTCGLQGPDLGRDETSIVQICISLIDTFNMQIIGERNILLRPSSLLDSDAAPDKIHISIPSREMMGLASIPTDGMNATLKEALDDIDKLITFNLHKKSSEVTVIPLTVGHLPLRSVLHREARFRNITLAKYWFNYFDICDQMSICYKASFSNLNDIFSALQIPECRLSVEIMQNMSQVVQHLLRFNHVFIPVHRIVNEYKPAVFHVDDHIDEDVVVMIKPIDYKTPISHVLPFFNGVNIADGGIAVVMSEGRRSNKILIRFVDRIQRDIALLRDKHHLDPDSSRYITMSIFESQEFMKIAGYENDDVKYYLMQLTNHQQILLRMKGLPFTVTKNDILQFFNCHDTEIQFGLDGIFLVQKQSGELNGDAFIIFKNEEDSTKATHLKGSMIGNRYVEIFHSTPAEMNQVIAGIKLGTNLSKPVKKCNKNRDVEKSESLYTAYQTSFGLLNAGVAQNNSSNMLPSISAAIMTTFIPKEATDSDFVNFLGESRGSCISISKYNIHNPKGYISYIAGFKDISSAEMVAKILTDKPFKIDLIDKEFHVSTIALPLASAPINRAYYNNNQIIQKSALNAINVVPNMLPYTTSIIHPSFNICCPLPIANGSLINYGTIPSIYSLDQYNPLNIYQNFLTSNLLGGQPQTQYPSQSQFIQNAPFNINSSNNTLLLQNLSLAANVSKPIFVGKSNIVLLYGVQIQFLQIDFDTIFSSIAQYISALPKMYQNNQHFYAIFNSPEDVKAALLRCPIILYKNQTIHLIAIDQ